MLQPESWRHMLEWWARACLMQNDTHGVYARSARVREVGALEQPVDVDRSLKTSQNMFQVPFERGGTYSETSRTRHAYTGA